jgi:hypothetical protein
MATNMFIELETADINDYKKITTVAWNISRSTKFWLEGKYIGFEFGKRPPVFKYFNTPEEAKEFYNDLLSKLNKYGN